jgi:hypothetical protein
MTQKSDTLAAIVRVVMFGGCFWFGECSGLWGFDEFHLYVQRNDRMTMTSGDAKEVNAVTQIPTPWPRGVSDRRIVSDSAHMQRALDWYRRSARRPDPMPDVTLPDASMGSSIPTEGNQGGGGGGGTAAAAPYSAQ